LPYIDSNPSLPPWPLSESPSLSIHSAGRFTFRFFGHCGSLGCLVLPEYCSLLCHPQRDLFLSPALVHDPLGGHTTTKIFMRFTVRRRCAMLELLFAPDKCQESRSPGAFVPSSSYLIILAPRTVFPADLFYRIFSILTIVPFVSRLLLSPLHLSPFSPSPLGLRRESFMRSSPSPSQVFAYRKVPYLSPGAGRTFPAYPATSFVIPFLFVFDQFRALCFPFLFPGGYRSNFFSPNGLLLAPVDFSAV